MTSPPAQPIRRSERIARLQNKAKQPPPHFQINSIDFKNSSKVKTKIFKISNRKVNLNARNSVRVEKESVAAQIARLQAAPAARQEQEGPVQHYTVSSFQKPPLWCRQRKTEPQQSENVPPRRKITFSPHAIAAAGAAEYRKQQRAPAPTPPPPPPPVPAVRQPASTAPTVLQPAADLVELEVQRRVEIVRQQIDQEACDRVTQHIDQALDIERRKTTQEINQIKNRQTEEEQILLERIERLQLRLKNQQEELAKNQHDSAEQITLLQQRLREQEGETVDATNQIATQDHQLRQLRTELSTALNTIQEERGRVKLLQQQLEAHANVPTTAVTPIIEFESAPLPDIEEISTISTDPTPQKLALIESPEPLPSAPTSIYPALPTINKPQKSVSWEDLHRRSRRARSSSPKSILQRILPKSRTRRSLSPTRIPKSVLKKGKYASENDLVIINAHPVDPGNLGKSSKTSPEDQEDLEVAGTMCSKEPPTRPRAVNPGIGSIHGTRHLPGGWSSPVDDTEDEIRKISRHGPDHPLPPKIHRNFRSPTRSWEIPMPARVPPLPPMFRRTPAATSSAVRSRSTSSPVADTDRNSTTRTGQPDRRSPRLAAKMGRKRSTQDDLVDFDPPFHGFKPIDGPTSAKNTTSSSQPPSPRLTS